jgi:Protein of unknown function (DUF1573)
MLRHWFGFFGCLLLVGSANAGSWADGMFTDLSKDFGTVPRGPLLSYPFHIKNNTNTPIHISNIRVSCGCVSANPMTNLIRPGEETAIMAQMDTTRFEGAKTVKIYVTFDQPRYEEVQLWVQANSREDVNVSPEGVNLGQIKRGGTPTATVNVTFYGSGPWQVLGCQSESNYVRTQIREVKRQAFEVTYQLTAQLRADAPVGKWYTDIWLKTSNAATPKVRVPVNVEIESALSVSPSVVDLGQVKIGNSVQRKIIVRGVQPFKITAVRGTDGELLVQNSGSDSRPVHVLAITLKPDHTGDMTRQLRILTDLPEGGEIEVQAKAHIAP